jgi:ribonuclease BN (tRNA processing enzyme)
MSNPPADTITFLGTAGARFMVTRQLAASGGLWLKLGDTQILIDPGPGSLVQSAKRRLNAERLSAIILSHRHLDHSADVNIMVEAMTGGGFKRHGRLFAPSDALGAEPVIFSYLKDYIEGVSVLEAGGTYRIGSITFTTPVRHLHPVETYGMAFNTGERTFSYIADSRFFDGLWQSYTGELLIINTVLMEPKPPVDHLSVPDAERIISKIKPKVAILNHFGMGIWQAKPEAVARRLSEKTGVNVIAARDGMTFNLSEMEEGS